MLPLRDLHSQLDEALNIHNVDSSFSSLYYTDLINEQRSLFIRNEYNKKRELDPNLIQSIDCLELELTDPHTCCIEVPVGCKILRTKEKIPNTIELHYSKTITVGPIILTAPRFNMITYGRLAYIGEGRTTRNRIYSFLHDNYIYVISKNPDVNLIKYISIRGIFEDPTSLRALTNCTGESCWSPDNIYPINQWMWAYVKGSVIQQLIQKLQIPADNSNNSKDDVTGNSSNLPKPEENAQ